MSDPFTDATPRLALPYLAAGQAHKHLTLNEAMARLDALVQASAESRALAAQPAAPAEGVLYLLPAGATGADWAGRPAGVLMRRDAGAWVQTPAPKGMILHIRDEGRLLVRQAGGWAPLEALSPVLGPLTRLGIGALADDANPLTARLNAALFTARDPAEGGDGSLRLKLNKTATTDIASLLFQVGFTGRAELGLLADERLALKVSADGASWREVFTVDPADGRAAFTRGAVRSELTVLTVDGPYSPPAWARRLEVTAFGGGGGGGAGASGTAASVRFGGGGGAAGGFAHETFEVTDLDGALSVIVGQGGGGGGGQVNGSGTGGAPGGASTVGDGGGVLLAAGGGSAGAGGTVTSGAAGTAVPGWPVAGAAGGASQAAATGAAGGLAQRYAGGGGGGGAIDTAGAQRAGGAGGVGYAQGGAGGRRAVGGAGGGAAAPGGGGQAKRWVRGAGAGGGGGGAGAGLLEGGAGGPGGAPAGGGGGGGAARESASGGSGGRGGDGQVWILALG